MVSQQAHTSISPGEAIALEEYQDYIVSDNSICQGFIPDEFVPPVEPYRLYRFLTDLDDILAHEPDEATRIRRIIPLVRTLLTSSEWLQFEYTDPSPKTGWSVKMLYREPSFPLTVQMVAWEPNRVSTIHNHGTWGIVALIRGTERNTLWRRSPTPDHPGRIEKVGEQLLVPGDIIGFTPNAIHCIEAIGDEPTISFNLYGVTDYPSRYQFDIATHTAKNF